MKVTLLLSLLLFLSCGDQSAGGTSSETENVLTAKIIDSEEVASLARVSILNDEDWYSTLSNNSAFKEYIADENGQIKVENLGDGIYRALIETDSMGAYFSFEIKDSLIIDADTIILSPKKNVEISLALAQQDADVFLLGTGISKKLNMGGGALFSNIPDAEYLVLYKDLNGIIRSAGYAVPSDLNQINELMISDAPVDTNKTLDELLEDIPKNINLIDIDLTDFLLLISDFEAKNEYSNLNKEEAWVVPTWTDSALFVNEIGEVNEILPNSKSVSWIAATTKYLEPYSGESSLLVQYYTPSSGLDYSLTLQTLGIGGNLNSKYIKPCFEMALKRPLEQLENTLIFKMSFYTNLFETHDYQIAIEVKSEWENYRFCIDEMNLNELVGNGIGLEYALPKQIRFEFPQSLNNVNQFYMDEIRYSPEL